MVLTRSGKKTESKDPAKAPPAKRVKRQAKLEPDLTLSPDANMANDDTDRAFPPPSETAKHQAKLATDTTVSPDKNTDVKTDAKEDESEQLYEPLEITINRAPVLTIWATVVAEKQGYDRDEAYTFASWITTLLAKSKGKALGIYEKKEHKHHAHHDPIASGPHVNTFAQIKVPVIELDDGKKYAARGNDMLDPDETSHYLESKFGSNLTAVQTAMKYLVDSCSADEVRERAYDWYEEFRPDWKGWGKPGTLNVDKLYDMAARNRKPSAA